METARQLLLDSAAALSLDGQPDAAVLDSGGSASWRRPQRAGRLGRRQRAGGRRSTAREVAGTAGESGNTGARSRGCGGAGSPAGLAAVARRAELGRDPDARHYDHLHRPRGSGAGSLSEARRMRDRVAAIEYDIQEFRQQVEPLAARNGLPLDSDDRQQLALIADEIIRRLEETQTAFSGRERAREQAEENRQLLESRERRLQSAEEELAALLAAGGADGAEDFRRRARQHEERLELERRRDEHRRSVERLSGPGQRFDAFCQSLASADPNLLGDEAARLSELHAEVDAKRNALREERGRTDSELEQLTDEEESSALRVRRSTLEEQLREHAREWSRLTIAEALLEKTRQKFEQERQPSVIRYAEKFFSGVTGQRYRRLYAPIGEQTITVTDAAGGSKQPAGAEPRHPESSYTWPCASASSREFGEHAERFAGGW